MKILNILEKYSDLGKLSPEQLTKGQPLHAADSNNFKQVSGRMFNQIVTRLGKFDGLRESPKGLHTLSVYSVEEYNKMQCFIGNNNTSGYAIKDGDELISVFSTAGRSGKAIMADAVKRGVSRLDCFARRDANGNIVGPLVDLYSLYGFKIDTSMNQGNPDEPYAIVNGVSSFVNDSGQVEPDNPNVVVFMVR